MNEAQFQAFLERYARALNEADLTAIAACWAIPSLLVSDAGAQAILSEAEVRDHFVQARKQTEGRGLIATKPWLEQASVLSEKIAALDVRWSDFDGAGVEQVGARNRYLLRLEDDGQLRIHVAVTRTL